VLALDVLEAPRLGDDSEADFSTVLAPAEVNQQRAFVPTLLGEDYLEGFVQGSRMAIAA
jgi:hypothetical protein